MLAVMDANQINELHRHTFAGEIGLIINVASRDEVIGELAVLPKHCQPQGIVHGGVYATIIESLASIGAAIDASAHGRNVVGLENHTSFVRATRTGRIHGKATPLTRGRRSQLWEVMLRNDAGEIAATGRVRLMLLEPEASVGGAQLKP